MVVSVPVVIGTLWAVTVLAALAAAALTLVAADELAHGDLASNLALSVSVAAYATLGALIVRRAGHAIGWLMLAAGAAQAFLTLASIYAVIGVATFPGSLPAARQVGTLAECSFSAVSSRSGSCSCSSRPGHCRRGAGGRWRRPA